MPSDQNTCANLKEKFQDSNPEILKFVEEKLAPIKDPSVSEIDKIKYVINSIYDMQYFLQKKLYELYPMWNINPEIFENLLKPASSEEYFSIAKSIFEWIAQNIEYIEDEWRELVNALGGEALGSATWKRHKYKHGLAKEMIISEFLSPKEKFEILYEYVDIIHFVMNLFILIKATLNKKDVDAELNTIAKNIKKENETKDFENMNKFTFWDLVVELREIYNTIRKILSNLYDTAQDVSNLKNSNSYDSKKTSLTSLMLTYYKTIYDNTLNLMNIVFTKLFTLINWAIFNNKLTFGNILEYYLLKNAENLLRWENKY